VPGRSTTVCCRTVVMVRVVGVPSDCGALIMGTYGVITLHFWEMVKRSSLPHLKP
jgi:hypothetical protein